MEIIRDKTYVKEVVHLFGNEMCYNCTFLDSLVITPNGVVNAAGWGNILFKNCRVISPERYLAGDHKLPATKEELK